MRLRRKFVRLSRYYSTILCTTSHQFRPGLETVPKALVPRTSIQPAAHAHTSGWCPGPAAHLPFHPQLPGLPGPGLPQEQLGKSQTARPRTQGPEHCIQNPIQSSLHKVGSWTTKQKSSSGLLSPPAFGGSTFWFHRKSTTHPIKRK